MATSNSTESNCFAAALRLLTGRDRSESELHEKLQQFGFSAADIDLSLEKCREYRYLDDRRYATERARALIRSGRGIGPKILLDLRQRGISNSTASAALKTVNNEFDSEQLLRDQLQRRFANFDFASADQKQRRRVIGFFQRRGFPLELIFRILKQE